MLPVHRYRGTSASTDAILNPLLLEKRALVEDADSSTPGLGTFDMMRAVTADDARAQKV